MKRSHLITTILTAALLLCGCGSVEKKQESEAQNIPTAGAAGSGAGTDSTTPDSSAPDSSVPDRTEPTTLRPREAADKLTQDHTINDYTVTAKCRVITGESPYRSTTYEGVITDEKELESVWKLVSAAEAEPPEKFAGFFGNTSRSKATVTLTPKWGGQEVVISESIGYYNEGEEGGPEVLLFTGLTAEDGTVWSMLHTGDFDRDWLESFCGETIITRGEITEENIEDSEPDRIENSRILYVSRSDNWAWGVYDRLSFIDTDGYIYTMTLADDEDYGYRPLTVEELLPQMEKMIDDESVRPDGRVSEADLESLSGARAIGEAIPEDAKQTEDRSVMCDAGQTTLYFITDRVIELMTRGDNEHELDDFNAGKLTALYSQLTQNAERYETMP